ncbi:hypothetical protein DSECCO2_288570 [anaerobic digester metagenome]
MTVPPAEEGTDEGPVTIYPIPQGKLLLNRPDGKIPDLGPAVVIRKGAAQQHVEISDARGNGSTGKSSQQIPSQNQHSHQDSCRCDPDFPGTIKPEEKNENQEGTHRQNHAAGSKQKRDHHAGDACRPFASLPGFQRTAQKHQGGEHHLIAEGQVVHQCTGLLILHNVIVGPAPGQNKESQLKEQVNEGYAGSDPKIPEQIVRPAHHQYDKSTEQAFAHIESLGKNPIVEIHHPFHRLLIKRHGTQYQNHHQQNQQDKGADSLQRPKSPGLEQGHGVKQRQDTH